MTLRVAHHDAHHDQVALDLKFERGLGLLALHFGRVRVLRGKYRKAEYKSDQAGDWQRADDTRGEAWRSSAPDTHVAISSVAGPPSQPRATVDPRFAGEALSRSIRRRLGKVKLRAVK